jgi:HK97 family phage major capsid protein
MRLVKSKEQQAAELLEKLNGLFEGDEGLPKMVNRLKVLEANFEELKGLNIKKAMEDFDRLKSGQETLTKQIRYSKRGLYVPGIEDEKFSVLKAMCAVRTGDWKGAEHEKSIMDEVRTKASHQVGNDTLGGFFVPDQVIPEVIGAIYTRSVFINLQGEGQTRVSVLEGLTGGNVKVPKFDGGLIAYWIGEEDEYAESSTAVGDLTMNPKKMGVLIRITDTMRKLQGFGFENLLRQDMIRAAAKKLDWTILYGTGTNDMPRGITRMQGIKIWRAENSTLYNPTTAAAVADWQGGELTFDGLQNMMLALEEDDITLDESAMAISSPRYFTRLKQLKIDNYSGQTINQPYLLGAPYLSSQRLMDIIGPFDKSTQIGSADLPGAAINGVTTSVTAKFSPVLHGNLNNVVVGRWFGLEIEDDSGKGKGFTSDHTYMKLRMYADVGSRQERSLILCPDARARA